MAVMPRELSGIKPARCARASPLRLMNTLTRPYSIPTAMNLAPAIALIAACSGPPDSCAQPERPRQPDTHQERRDPLKQPFASTSIWNMPIGRHARYVPAGLSPTPGKHNRWAGMPFIDEERIVLTPQAPLTPLRYSSAAWTGNDRCGGPTGALVAAVPIPRDYVVPHSTENNAAAFLLPDGRTIVQTQPLGRCSAGAAGTTFARYDNVDLYGDGIGGAHGGSGLSAIGGSIRLGELRPGARTGPRHALKVNVYAKEALFECASRDECFRWPARSADTGAAGSYGSASHNANRAMRMGALLAIPPWKKIASLRLETEPGRQLAWTLQNYGAYVVDDTSAPGFALNVEDGPSGSKRAEFKADWGFDMAQKLVHDTPWRRDVQKLVQALYVVDNNGPGSIGGGGPPRQPLAAPIAP
jgi:hypothetical protein